jgi:predicted MFS family arabinose efflux permease
LAFVTISLTTNLVVVTMALAAYIAHSVVWNILAASVRQKATPDAMMGRVGAVSRLIGLCGLATGAAAGGVLASEFGYRVPFAVAGSLFAVAALYCLTAIGNFRAWEDLADSSPFRGQIR